MSRLYVLRVLHVLPAESSNGCDASDAHDVLYDVAVEIRVTSSVFCCQASSFPMAVRLFSRQYQLPGTHLEAGDLLSLLDTPNRKQESTAVVFQVRRQTSLFRCPVVHHTPCTRKTNGLSLRPLRLPLGAAPRSVSAALPCHS